MGLENVIAYKTIISEEGRRQSGKNEIEKNIVS